MKNSNTSYRDFKIQKIVNEDNKYPKQLLDLKQAPKQLYYRGELDSRLFNRSIAIVGSRRMTRYGASVIDRFVAHFVQNGITTISGYMYGVDTEVHSKTVEYGGKTVAIMGGGINSPYPPENDKMYTKILHTDGVVMSEYDPESKPKLWMYPQRNRIVAALASIGILVIEASERSGSLITVKYGTSLKKNIFAIPGQITSSVSSGTNYLIKEGIARLVTSPEDIVGQLVKKGSKSTNDNLDLTPLEKSIYELLKSEEMSIDEIAVALEKSVVETSTTVSMMSLKGHLSEAGGKYFVVV